MDWEEHAAHQTRLAQWALRTIGNALLVSALIGGVLSIIAVVGELTALAALAPAAGFIAFGIALAGADAPRAP